MKKILVLTILILSFQLSFSSLNEGYHIGVITGEKDQSKDSYRGAKNLIRQYGDSKNGGIITHVIFPKDFTKKRKAVINELLDLAKDPKMKGIIMTESIPGTLEAFRKIKKEYPKILLISNTPHEDTDEISKTSDLVITTDNISRGYLIVKGAQEMGAKKFAHLSFKRHMDNKVIAKRRRVMMETAKDLNLDFIDIIVPDPQESQNIEKTKEEIYKKTSQWIKKYGKDTAFFITSSEESAPLIKGILENGGYFVESDLPSLMEYYPKALGLEVEERQKPETILKEVEKEILEKDAPYRMGTWTYSYNYSTTVAIGNHLVDVLNDKAKINDFKSIIKALEKETKEAEWNGSKAREKNQMENTFLFYQDTYVFGHGYLYLTDLKIPDKYFQMK